MTCAISDVQTEILLLFDFFYFPRIFHSPPLFSNGVSNRGRDKLSLRELFFDPRSRFLQIFLSSKVYNSLSRDDTRAYIKI